MKARTVALVAVFAALYFILSLLPDIPCVGVPEVGIELGASFASIFGAVLGPYAGGLAALIGTLIAYAWGGGGPYGLPFIFCPAMNAVTVGLMFRKKFAAAAAVMAALVASFWFTPIAQPVSEHWVVGLAATFDKMIALALIAPAAWMMKRSGALSREGSKVKASALTFTQLLVAAFVGNEADNALGNAVFALPIVFNGVFGFTLEATRWAFLVSPFVYPAVRLIQAFLAAVVGLPLMKALEAGGWL